WEPAGTVVFARPLEHAHPCGTTGAESCCGATQFFATAQHAAAWSASHSTTYGHTFTQVEALEYAAMLFAGVLDRIGDETSSLAAGAQRTMGNAQPGIQQAGKQMPRIQVLYLPSCPHTLGALELVCQVLQGEGLPTAVELIAIETQTAAEQHRFYGSPT